MTTHTDTSRSNLVERLRRINKPQMADAVEAGEFGK